MYAQMRPLRQPTQTPMNTYNMYLGIPDFSLAEQGKEPRDLLTKAL